METQQYSHLPDEIILEIIQNSQSIHDLLNLYYTNWRFREILTSQSTIKILTMKPELWNNINDIDELIDMYNNDEYIRILLNNPNILKIVTKIMSETLHVENFKNIQNFEDLVATYNRIESAKYMNNNHYHNKRCLKYLTPTQCYERARFSKDKNVARLKYAQIPVQPDGEPNFVSSEPSFVSSEPSFVFSEPSFVSSEPSFVSNAQALKDLYYRFREVRYSKLSDVLQKQFKGYPGLYWTIPANKSFPDDMPENVIDIINQLFYELTLLKSSGLYEYINADGSLSRDIPEDIMEIMDQLFDELQTTKRTDFPKKLSDIPTRLSNFGYSNTQSPYITGL
jgi:hypothetical protein